jgi:preprotein translocase subunit SecD
LVYVVYTLLTHFEALLAHCLWRALTVEIRTPKHTKDIILIKTILFFLIASIASGQLSAQQTQLKTGCYYVIDNSTGSCVKPQPDKSGQTYCLETKPIVTKADFLVVELNEFILEQKTEYALIIRLNDKGRDEFTKATDKYTGKRIAFVIDDHLVMAPIVKTRIESGIVRLDTLHWTHDELKNFYEIINSSLKR